MRGGGQKSDITFSFSLSRLSRSNSRCFLGDLLSRSCHNWRIEESFLHLNRLSLSCFLFRTLSGELPMRNANEGFRVNNCVVMLLPLSISCLFLPLPFWFPVGLQISCWVFWYPVGYCCLACCVWCMVVTSRLGFPSLYLCCCCCVPFHLPLAFSYVSMDNEPLK